MAERCIRIVPEKRLFWTITFLQPTQAPCSLRAFDQGHCLVLSIGHHRKQGEGTILFSLKEGCMFVARHEC